MGTAGVCDSELDWSMDLADGAGNGGVRKPGIRAMKALRNLSQTERYLFCCGTTRGAAAEFGEMVGRSRWVETPRSWACRSARRNAWRILL